MPATRRTLGDLRDEVLRRLGFQDQGPQAQANRALIEDFVRAAQRELWWSLEIPALRRVADITVSNAVDIQGRPQIYWDWPQDCDPRRLFIVSALVTNWWRELERGIGPEQDSLTATGYRAYPQRFDIGPQLEIWPAPDRDYTVRLEYQAVPARFTQPADACTLDADLILLHALVNAKAHYRHEDAAVYAKQLSAVIGRIRAGSHGLGGPARTAAGDAPPMPVRV